MLGPRWQASGQPAPGPTDTDHREGIGLPSDPIQASRVRACAREEVVGVRDGRERVPTVMTVTRGWGPRDRAPAASLLRPRPRPSCHTRPGRSAYRDMGLSGCGAQFMGAGALAVRGMSRRRRRRGGGNTASASRSCRHSSWFCSATETRSA